MQELKAAEMPATRRMDLMRRADIELKKNPRNVDALLTMASLAAMDRSATQAVEYLRKALALRKRDSDILRRLVSACLDARLFVEARNYARKLCETEPRVAHNHRTLGLILEESGKPNEALAAYERAMRIGPADASMLHDLGRVHAQAGHHDKAIEFYEKSSALDPKYGLALYSLSQARRFRPDEVDAFVARCNGAIDSTQDPVLIANLNYGCGKVLDDVGRYEEAFAYFAEANRGRVPPGGTLLTPFYKNSVDAFPRTLFQLKHGFGLPTRQPIFVFGMPRSGTTLTESLLGAHSKITAGDEQVFMAGYSRHLGKDSSVTGAYARNVGQLNAAEIRELAEDYLKRCAGIMGSTPHFTDKIPHNFQNVGFIQLMFPNASMIHVRRHPLDNCLSLYSNSMLQFHNEYKTELPKLGLYFRHYLQLMDHWRAVLPGRMHELYYEDLVANTEWNARAMIAHLGLPWEDGVMNRAGSQRSVRTLSNWQARQPVYSSSMGKWRNYEKFLGPVIDALGPYVEAYEKELAALATEKPL